MSELTVFIEARLAEDETLAKFAIEAAGEPGWVFHETPYGRCWEIAGETEREDSTGFKWWASVTHDQEGLSDSVVREAGPHIARHDPARVLVEVEAKRAIVALHSAYEFPQVMTYGTIIACNECGSVDDSPVEWPCPTLRALALPYSDHPEFRAEEWA